MMHKEDSLRTKSTLSKLYRLESMLQAIFRPYTIANVVLLQTILVNTKTPLANKEQSILARRNTRIGMPATACNNANIDDFDCNEKNNFDLLGFTVSRWKRGPGEQYELASSTTWLSTKMRPGWGNMNDQRLLFRWRFPMLPRSWPVLLFEGGWIPVGLP